MLNRQHLTPILFLWLCIVLLTSCGNTEPKGAMVTETYTVQAGDTLWTIAEAYIVKNTGGSRYMPEFISGIEELNDELFRNRVPGDIRPGDKLVINYFIK